MWICVRWWTPLIPAFERQRQLGLCRFESSRQPRNSVSKKQKQINTDIHMYSFQSLKVIGLRTGIDLQRLMTNHVPSCVFFLGKASRTCTETCFRGWHVYGLLCFLPRLSPGPCTLGKCSSRSTFLGVKDSPESAVKTGPSFTKSYLERMFYHFSFNFAQKSFINLI